MYAKNNLPYLELKDEEVSDKKNHLLWVRFDTVGLFKRDVKELRINNPFLNVAIKEMLELKCEDEDLLGKFAEELLSSSCKRRHRNSRRIEKETRRRCYFLATHFIFLCYFTGFLVHL